MTKSLFSFFQNTAIGRKLAYAATPTPGATRSNSSSQKRNSIIEGINNHVLAQDMDVPLSRVSSMVSENLVQYSRRCEKYLDGKVWMALSVIATITSLLAYDFTMAFLPKSVDLSTDVILLVVFAFFFVELIVASLVRSGYFLSFWFWLDFIAMVSMIPDLTLLLHLLGSEDGDINMANTQASKAGKSARSSMALKAIRMIRFSRMVRVLRVFKYFQTDDEVVEENPVDAGSSKVGQIVSESVTKKVIILVLVLVLVLPWMDPSGASYSDGATTATLLYKTLLDSGADAEASLELFSQVGVPILQVQINGERLLDQADIVASRRNVEMWSLYLDDAESEWVLFDIRDNVVEEALMGMCLTLFAILIFASSTIFVTASTMSLVVAPIARLTELLTKMAGVIGLLGGARTVEKLMESKDELFIVEALCGRIMDVFGGGSSSVATTSSKGGRKSNSEKAISMMASRKITQITSGDRIWEIDVKEKHRTSIIEQRVDDSFAVFLKQAREASHDEADEKGQDDEEQEVSLRSLKAIVDNPITLYCLRMFMTKNLTINNLLFVLEAEDWAAETRRKFNSLCHKYCDNISPAQINLTAKQFACIKRVTKGDAVLTDKVFAEALSETWSLMERNIFKQFLASDYCKFYVHMKNNDPFTLNQLQLSIVPVNNADAEQGKPKANVIRTSECAINVPQHLLNKPL